MVGHSKTLSFNYDNGCIRISHEVFKLLGYPKFIKILLNAGKRQIVVLSTDKCDLDRIKLNYKSKSIFKDPRLYSKLLVEKIFITSDWNLNKSYRVNVEFDHDKGGFTSDLTKAIELGAK